MEKNVINHFSHTAHPLVLGHLKPQTLETRCNACNHAFSSTAPTLAYVCRPCRYALHDKCANFPPLITHTSHQQHNLSLRPTERPEDACRACGRPASAGMSYQCSAEGCNFSLHGSCSWMPTSVKLWSHSMHQLSLCFAPPYHNKIFLCDVCGNSGSSDQWLYHCNACLFDVHLGCAEMQLAQTQTQAQAQALAQAQGQLGQQVLVNRVPMQPNYGMLNNQNNNYNYNYGRAMLNTVAHGVRHAVHEMNRGGGGGYVDVGSSFDNGGGDFGSSFDIGGGDFGSSFDFGGGDFGSSFDFGGGDFF